MLFVERFDLVLVIREGGGRDGDAVLVAVASGFSNGLEFGVVGVERGVHGPVFDAQRLEGLG